MRQYLAACYMTSHSPPRHAAVTYARGRFIIKTSVSFLYIIGRGSTLSPRPFPIQGKGAALEDIPPPLAGEIAQPGQTVKGRPPQNAAGVPPLDGPLPAVQHKPRRRGIYHRRAHPKRRARTSGQSVQKRGPVTCRARFSSPALPVRAAVSLSTRPAGP